MEAKIFTIGKVTFKQSACSHYFIKQGDKFVKVTKQEYIEANEKAIREEPETLKLFIGNIAKPIARKLTRRFYKGYKPAVNWFNETAALFNVSTQELKRQLKAI